MHLSCFPNITLGRLEHSKLIEALPPSSEVVELCSTANFGSSNSPAVACMHAATDIVATAVVIVVVGSEADPYKLTSVKSASVKSSTVEATVRETKAATAEAASA